MPISKVSVVGLGYIGLPTAAVIASNGVEVVGVDVNEQVVATINQGNIHIVEPGLAQLVSDTVRNSKLRASVSPESAQVFIIAVPTPFDSHQKPDLSYIESAAKMIAPVLETGNLVILESTSPVGATERMAEWLAQARPDLAFPNQSNTKTDIHIAHCPERVLPGKVLEELVTNDRIIGGMSQRCSELAKELYAIFVEGKCIVTHCRTAEMAKLTENAFRDVNIAFANELSIICDELDINVWELISLSNRHPRVNILSPGPGVGGHCIAVDPWFIVDSAPDSARLIKTAREVNDNKPNYVINKIVHAAKTIEAPVIACLGLSFKADIDDLRESPALFITEMLAEKINGEVLAVEPNIQFLPEKLDSKHVKLVSMEDALDRANIILVLVDHKEFKNIPANLLDSKIVFDTKGIINLEQTKNNSF